jgi:hypothetical protein
MEDAIKSTRNTYFILIAIHFSEREGPTLENFTLHADDLGATSSGKFARDITCWMSYFSQSLQTDRWHSV